MRETERVNATIPTSWASVPFPKGAIPSSPLLIMPSQKGQFQSHNDTPKPISSLQGTDLEGESGFAEVSGCRHPRGGWRLAESVVLDTV